MTAEKTPVAASASSSVFTYDHWMESLGLPIHKGFFIQDTRTIDLEYWPERGCKTAFIQLMGQEGVSEARVSEIAPGASTTPLKFAMDEVVYVLQGRGITSVWGGETGERRTFEWHPRSMFVIPHNAYHEHHNMQGNQAVRLLHYNYLPLGMSVVNDPDFFFNNPFDSLAHAGGDHLDWLRSQLSVLLVCGQGMWEDTTGALPSSRALAGLLGEKGIRCELDLWGHDVPHDWPSWQAQLVHHLPRFC